MKNETKSLAILAMYSMCERRASKVRSLGHDIEYKQSVIKGAKSASVKTRATNELAALERNLIEAKTELDEAEAAMEDLRVSG